MAKLYLHEGAMLGLVPIWVLDHRGGTTRVLGPIWVQCIGYDVCILEGSELIVNILDIIVNLALFGSVLSKQLF